MLVYPEAPLAHGVVAKPAEDGVRVVAAVEVVVAALAVELVVARTALNHVGVRGSAHGVVAVLAEQRETTRVAGEDHVVALVSAAGGAAGRARHVARQLDPARRVVARGRPSRPGQGRRKQRGSCRQK
jgi:phosphoribosylamine-glycine ligase